MSAGSVRNWIAYLWERLRGSLWFVPGLMCAGAGLLAWLTAVLDGRVVGGDYAWLYHGDPESARTLLSTVAGSMITVAGVSFSVTMVALSLTSSQFGPRLLANFMRDRGNQVVFGSFVGTFLFCVLALGSTVGAKEEFVSVSATVALVLTTISLLMLVYFIHHIALSMQADHLIEGVARELRHSLDRIFPETEEGTGRVPSLPDREGPSFVVTSPRTGYLQRIDSRGLLRTAAERDLRLEVLRGAGQFVLAGAPLVEVIGSGGDAGIEERVRGAFITGGHRTADQDPEYAVRQLVEIAVRALSPGINDPFTASTCVDRLSGGLGLVAPRPELPPVMTDEAGEPRVKLPLVRFEDLVDAAFDRIRRCSRTLPSVAMRLLEALAALAAATPDPSRRRAIARQARLVVETSADAMIEADREALLDRYREVRRVTGADDKGRAPDAST